MSHINLYLQIYLCILYIYIKFAISTHFILNIFYKFRIICKYICEEEKYNLQLKRQTATTFVKCNKNFDKI